MWKKLSFMFSAKVRTICITIIALLSLVSCTKKDETQNETTKTLVILGSSTAEGIGASPRDSSWANKIKFRLIKDAIESKEINLALSGYSTSEILPSGFLGADTNRNVTKALSYHPQLVIINLPSNDFVYGRSDDQILNNFKIIINEIDSSGTPYILISTQPRNFFSYDMRKRLALFNTLLQTNFTFHLLNVYNDLATPDYYQKPEVGVGDGVHLNNLGHDIVYTKVLNDSLFRKIFYNR